MRKYMWGLSLILLFTGCKSGLNASESVGIEPIEVQKKLVDVQQEMVYIDYDLPLTDDGIIDTETYIYENIQKGTLLRRDDLQGVLTPVMSQKVDSTIISLPLLLSGSAISETLPDGLANYILFEMERSCYKYELTNYSVLGVDARTQRVFVDATFSTTGELKDVKSASRIVRGEPDYETKLKLRFARYDTMIRQKINEENPGMFYTRTSSKTYAELKEEFEKYYGKAQDILEEQRNLSLIGYAKEASGLVVAGGLANDGDAMWLTNTAGTTNAVNVKPIDLSALIRWGNDKKFSLSGEGAISKAINELAGKGETVFIDGGSTSIGNYTYSGMLQEIDTVSATHETLVFRFVLKPSTIDMVTGTYKIMSGYLYSRQNGERMAATVYDDAETIANYSKKVVWFIERVNKAVDTNNHEGLYKLLTDYSQFDKFYEDLFKYTYRVVSKSTPIIIGRSGSVLEVLDTRKIQMRGRDIDITMPVYLETVLYIIDISNDDDYKILGSKILSSQLVDEPTTLVRGRLDTTISSVEFRKITQVELGLINNLIVSISKLQTGNLIDSVEFDSLLNPAISTSRRLKLLNEAKTVMAKEKYSFVDLMTATSDYYIDVAVTEVYVSMDDKYYASNVTFGFIQRDGVWYLDAYTRDLFSGMQNIDMYDVTRALEQQGVKAPVADVPDIGTTE